MLFRSDGTLRPVAGVLSMCLLAKDQGIRTVLVPAANAAEAALVDGLQVVALKNLRELVQVLRGSEPLPVFQPAQFAKLVGYTPCAGPRLSFQLHEI